MNQSFHLYQLQKVDQQIDKIDNRLAAIDQILSSDEQVKQASMQSKNARLLLLAAESALRESEANVSAKRIKIEQSEASLYGGSVRNPKELQDLQNEIASLKKHLAVLEDNQLESMVKCEEAEIHSKQLDQVLSEAQANAIERNASLNAEHDQLSKHRDTLLLEKNAVSAQLQPESIATYNKLRQQKKGVVVAIVDEDACSVCGSEISPADRQAARSPIKIVFCSFCGRIIYSG